MGRMRVQELRARPAPRSGVTRCQLSGGAGPATRPTTEDGCQRCDATRRCIRYGDVVGLHLSQIDEADELLTNDPLALLIGMVLDQQIGQTRNRI